MTLWNCRVCGLAYDESPWGPDDRSPDFTFCECCGAEFGFNDYSPDEARRHRSQWLAAGSPWYYPNLKPADWELTPQLLLIPRRFR